MADLTPNFNLEKATENEYYDVALHGRNMDKIDAALKANEGAVDDLAGEDRTTETVKGNADAINAHLADNATDAHKISNITGLQEEISKIGNAIKIKDIDIDDLSSIEEGQTLVFDGEKFVARKINSDQIPRIGLVAEYTMDAISGTSLIDTSGNLNNGVINNATSIAGVVGNALNFNGTNSFVDILNFDLNEDFTINMWIKNNVNTIAQVLLGSQTSEKPYLYFINRNDNRGLNIQYDNNSTALFLFPDNAFIDVSEGWVMVTFTREGNVFNSYKNAVLKNTATDSVSFSANLSNKRLGHSYINFYNGLIDQVRIYNRALSQDEIFSLYKEVS